MVVIFEACKNNDRLGQGSFFVAGTELPSTTCKKEMDTECPERCRGEILSTAPLRTREEMGIAFWPSNTWNWRYPLIFRDYRSTPGSGCRYGQGRIEKSSFSILRMLSKVYIYPTHPTRAGCDTRSILCRVHLVWSQSFPSWLVALPRLKNLSCPII